MRKTFGVAICPVLVILVLLGSLLPAAKADLILSLDGLLPSKSDDPTEYPVLQETEWYYGTSWSETLSLPEFVEGRAVEYYRRYIGPGDIRSVEFYAYLFADVNSAEVFCSSEVGKAKSILEATEISIAGAYGVVYEYKDEFMEMEVGVSWGTISNVVFKVVVYANLGEDPADRLIGFTSLERMRILDNGGNPSVPEFSSLIVIPFLVFATLLAFKVGRKSHCRIA